MGNPERVLNAVQKLTDNAIESSRANELPAKSRFR